MLRAAAVRLAGHAAAGGAWVAAGLAIAIGLSAGAGCGRGKCAALGSTGLRATNAARWAPLCGACFGSHMLQQGFTAGQAGSATACAGPERCRCSAAAAVAVGHPHSHTLPHAACRHALIHVGCCSRCGINDNTAYATRSYTAAAAAAGTWLCRRRPRAASEADGARLLRRRHQPPQLLVALQGCGVHPGLQAGQGRAAAISAAQQGDGRRAAQARRRSHKQAAEPTKPAQAPPRACCACRPNSCTSRNSCISIILSVSTAAAERAEGGRAGRVRGKAGCHLPCSRSCGGACACNRVHAQPDAETLQSAAPGLPPAAPHLRRPRRPAAAP